MSESLRTTVEVAFNLSYLTVIWLMVIIMGLRRKNVVQALRPQANLLFAGFLLLALGDTGHVGFRVWAYALGSLEARVSLGATNVPLVGAGAVATAFTVTILYFLLVELWRVRNGAPRGGWYWIAAILSLGRLVLMLMPGNAWGSVVPPYGWSLVRNLPLTLVGVGLAVAFLKSGGGREDRLQRNLGAWILVSFGFYLPVILFVQRVPIVGMLMIPKTLAYLAMAWLALRGVFPRRGVVAGT